MAKGYGRSWEESFLLSFVLLEYMILSKIIQIYFKMIAKEKIWMKTAVMNDFSFYFVAKYVGTTLAP